MTTMNRSKDKEIIKTLQKIHAMCVDVLKMNYETEQRTLLKIISLSLNNLPELKQVKKVCRDVLKKYPQGTFPHDSTLLDEAKERLPKPLRVLFPEHVFEQDLLLFKGYYGLISKQFDRIRDYPRTRQDRAMVDHVERIVRNVLVNNPNFKGTDPYYKRNYSQFASSKKLSLEFIEREFISIIDYFGEEDE